MNKSELIDKVAEASSLSKTDVDEALKAILNVITSELAKGNKVTLVGFGTFERRNRKARMGVNPQNPTQKIKIAAKKAPAFSPGSELKEAVQTGKAPALQLAKKKIAAKKAAVKAGKKASGKKIAAKR
jgi:DNA-binding protein HU-beta